MKAQKTRSVSAELELPESLISVILTGESATQSADPECECQLGVALAGS